MTVIQREHLESAIRGLCHELRKDAPDLDGMTYGQLALKYAALIDESGSEPLNEFEFNNINRGQTGKQGV